MKEYFQLQFRMLNRNMIEFGIPLWVGYSVIPLAFILLSNYLFSKTEFAPYLFMLFALSLISKLSDPKRNDFIKSIFSKPQYLILRTIENSVYAFPFLVYLAYNRLIDSVLILGLASIGLALVNINANLNFTLPTPFGKKPFEFLVGFRKTFFIFLIAYFLTFMAIVKESFNLGVFSMVIVSLVCLSYYSKPENEYFVWNFNVSPRAFLFEKIKACFINFTLLSLPIAIALGYFFFSEIGIIIAFYLLSYAYFMAMIFAKYAAFPHEIDLTQGILIGISFMFPPFLLVVIPYFYIRSIKTLQTILE